MCPGGRSLDRVFSRRAVGTRHRAKGGQNYLSSLVSGPCPIAVSSISSPMSISAGVDPVVVPVAVVEAAAVSAIMISGSYDIAHIVTAHRVSSAFDYTSPRPRVPSPCRDLTSFNQEANKGTATACATPTPCREVKTTPNPYLQSKMTIYNIRKKSANKAIDTPVY
jgi:hypothetical protein